ncbi:MAG: hypothetical protein ABI741_00090 [Ferruginibacter sp.]
MRQLTLFFTIIIVLQSIGQPANNSKEKKFTGEHPALNDTIKKQNAGIKKTGKEESWVVFWKAFTAAMNAKDKSRVAALTSKDFYDGGGGTVEAWLDAEVFSSDKRFIDFKNMLKKGVKNFKGYEGHPYKATGKNRSGDLFFEFKNKQWLFGGLVGD